MKTHCGLPSFPNSDQGNDTMRIALSATRIVDAMFPRAAQATVTILERLGHRWSSPDPACSGQRHVNSGYFKGAVPVVATTYRLSKPSSATSPWRLRADASPRSSTSTQCSRTPRATPTSNCDQSPSGRRHTSCPKSSWTSGRRGGTTGLILPAGGHVPPSLPRHAAA